MTYVNETIDRVWVNECFGEDGFGKKIWGRKIFFLGFLKVRFVGMGIGGEFLFYPHWGIFGVNELVLKVLGWGFDGDLMGI